MIILLVMAVVLTVGLSVVSQSITDVRLSQKEEEASRAFSAAEAGIEQVLIKAPSAGGSFNGSFGSAGYQVVRNDLGQGSTSFSYPGTFSSGETVTTFLVNHDDSGNLTCSGGAVPCFTSQYVDICWGGSADATAAPSTATAPALEVSVLYKNASGNYQTARVLADPYTGSDATRNGNNFANVTDSSGCTVGSDSLRYRQRIDFGATGLNIPSYTTAGNLVMLRTKLLYNSNSQKIGVKLPAGQLPSQGVNIGSVGTYGNSTQKVEVTQLYPDAPPVFDYALYSGVGGITK